MLKHLYYTLIYPYLNYGLMSWDTHTRKLNKIRTYQNKCIKSLFFANSRESASLYYSLLKILKFDNMFKLKIARFTYEIINKKENLPPIYSDSISLESSAHLLDKNFLLITQAYTNIYLMLFMFFH